jgi:hypothetical protein
MVHPDATIHPDARVHWVAKHLHDDFDHQVVPVHWNGLARPGEHLRSAFQLDHHAPVAP